MNIARSSLLLALIALTAACGNNRLLVGQDPDAGAPPTGAAGTSGANPSTGGAGTDGMVSHTGSAGYNGAAGYMQTPVETPLKISGDEAVHRLAQVIWKGLPDDSLVAQASLGVFTKGEDLHGPVRHLLADPRARAGVGGFFRWWLGLDNLRNGTVTKDPSLFPAFTPELAADMATETETFGVNMTLTPIGTNLTYAALMTAPSTYANERLAALYGVGGPKGNTTFQRIELDPLQRAGLLTQPALQALGSYESRNSPSKRGTYVSKRFLCQQIPEEPAGVVHDPAPAAPGTTIRTWLTQTVNQAANCRPCHDLIDPPGLAFETFDAIGRWRTTDNGAPVDVSGLRIGLLAMPPVVNGPVQLASALTQSDEGPACMARQLLTYALGRELTEADEPSVVQAAERFRGSGNDLKELFFAVLSTDAFLAP